MGKLHTLARAIRRDTEAFVYRVIRQDGQHYLFAKGAYFSHDTRQWIPDYWRHSYHSYVKHVLRQLGILAR